MAMWNSFSTDDRAAITAEVIAFPGGDGQEIHAYVARPDTGGPGPGVVAVHHMPGWDEFYREFCERLARSGYFVICPDLYCRYGHGNPGDIAARVRSEGCAHAKFEPGAIRTITRFPRDSRTTSAEPAGT